MQLRNARLCLNCEEIHAAAHCPVCASESFAYVSKWIPPEERRQEPRPAQSGPRPVQGARSDQSSPGMRWVRRGAAGVAVVAASRMLWQLSRPVEWNTPDVPEDSEASDSGQSDE